MGAPPSRGLYIRCPPCHQTVEILTDPPLAEINCSACRSHFSLVADDVNSDPTQSIKTLGHLQLIERLGVGGFGTVWKAHDMQLDRTVAVKLPRLGRLAAEETEQFSGATSYKDAPRNHISSELGSIHTKVRGQELLSMVPSSHHAPA